MIVQYAVAAVCLATVYGILKMTNDCARPKEPVRAEGRIGPSRPLTLTALLWSFALCAFGLLGALFWNAGLVGWLVFAMFGACLVVVAPMLYRASEVTWDAKSLTGPAARVIWPLVPPHATIAYTDMVRAGAGLLGSLYVVDAYGNRIRWNEYYADYFAAMIAVRNARPDLFRRQNWPPPRPIETGLSN